MDIVIRNKDIENIIDDAVPALVKEMDEYYKVKDVVSAYSSSLVNAVEDELKSRFGKILKHSISKNGLIYDYKGIEKIRDLVKNKKWNELDVMFGFDSPADHEKNREDMKCQWFR